MHAICARYTTFIGDAQIVCAYGVPPLFDIAGSIEQTEVQARYNNMQFVHALSIAQIVCCDTMPPHFELAGSIQQVEVQARHNSHPFCGHYAEMYSNWLR